MDKYTYMAGLLDGEGTIGITYMQNKTWRSPYVSVSSTTREIIDWLQENFGGTVCAHKVYQAHHKQSWSWRATKWNTLLEIFENVVPMMLEPEKIRRANLLLNEYKLVTPRNGKYTEQGTVLKSDFESRFLKL